ncbi:hypothetical protein GCM10027275_37640 [Rhabdobacter roseus]|uniref:Uncharacterized protein n=1 Tax=Rhabdobacter roseus TaxID=1655419 RepID=A0A840TW58_9BACT|nr:hypothetical protein [Rhabdobacter roseus]MBB5285827.1 hypothetical protein [Rhabdobacter roseus]
MKAGSLITFLVLVARIAAAQQEIAYDTLRDIHYYNIQSQNYDYRTNNHEGTQHTVAIKGSAFLYQGWQPGSITLDNGSTLPTELKFNLVENSLFLSLNGQELLTHPSQFSIKERDFVRIQHQYYEVLHRGKVGLLKSHRARLEHIQKNGYNESLGYDFEYSRNESLYLIHDSGSLTPLKLGERKVLSSLRGHHQQARAVVRELNLNLRREADLKVLLTRLDDCP